MNFVLDSSLAVAFFLEDEATDELEATLEKFRSGSVGVAPALWRWEVANTLRQAERRKRIDRAARQRHIRQIGALPIEIDSHSFEVAWSETLTLADQHDLSCYDAAYLELAIRRNLPLGTLDSALRRAAEAEGISVLP